MKAWFAAAVGADVTLGTDAANAERTPPEASRKKKRDSMKKTFFFMSEACMQSLPFLAPNPHLTLTLCSIYMTEDFS